MYLSLYVDKLIDPNTRTGATKNNPHKIRLFFVARILRLSSN